MWSILPLTRPFTAVLVRRGISMRGTTLFWMRSAALKLPLQMSPSSTHASGTTSKKKRRRNALNLTSAMQTVWQAKHSITDAAMTDFVAMAQHPKFDSAELRSGGTARRNRERFPLLPLYSLTVKTSDPPYNDAHGVLVSQPMTEFPFMSLADRIERLVRTPGAIDKLVTEARHGPVLKEQWHGRMFRENSLFTIDRFRADHVVYSLGECWHFRRSSESRGKVRVGTA